MKSPFIIKFSNKITPSHSIIFKQVLTAITFILALTFEFAGLVTKDIILAHLLKSMALIFIILALKNLPSISFQSASHPLR